MTISNALADQLQQRVNVKDNNDPCDVCIQNGALVIDCTQSCDWWRVIMDQDINSISLVGCPECPDIDFIVPAGACRKICGWPDGCNYITEDCFNAVICGGTTGRVAKTIGISYGGLPTGGSRGPKGQRSESCPCPPGTATLSIKCCSTDCVLDCGDTIRLKACGGVGPYTWSTTGTVTLSSSSGMAVSVTRPAAVSGLYPGVKAFLSLAMKVDFYVASLGVNTAQGTSILYDCDGAQLGTWPTLSEPTGIVVCVDHTGVNCLPCEVTTGPSDHTDGLDGILCATDATVLTGNSVANHYLNCLCDGNPPAGGPITAGNLTCTYDYTNNNQTPPLVQHSTVTMSDSAVGVDTFFPNQIDLRTQAMVDDHCSCAARAATATVTDATGASATTILHT